MKKTFRLFTSILLVFLFVSCSEDDNQIDNSEIQGVWETSEIEADETVTFTLVFGEANTGLSINAVVNTSGEETSSLKTFDWQFSVGTVAIIDADGADSTYEINEDGDLVLIGGEDVKLEKISNDYSAYY